MADHPNGPSAESCVRLERHINTRLIRQLPALNDTGLSSAYEAVWTILAAERIAALISGMDDVVQWQRMHPLIASILALHESGLISLQAHTLAGLRVARDARDARDASDASVSHGSADTAQTVLAEALRLPRPALP